VVLYASDRAGVHGVLPTHLVLTGLSVILAIALFMVLDRGHLLRLRAEMKLPGLAWLEMRVEPTAGGRTRYRQRALFFPHGLFGHLYWWSVAPFHAVVFGGMVRNLLRRAAQEDVSPGGGGPDAAAKRSR